MRNEEYAQGLRLLADFYEQHPEIQLPLLDTVRTGDKDYEFTGVSIYNVDSMEQMRAIVRALGSCRKEYRDDGFLVWRVGEAPIIYVESHNR